MQSTPSSPLMTNEEKATALFWLRIVIVFCLFLAALSVLDAFITLFTYWAFLTGRIDANLYPEWVKAFQEIQQAPFLFIVMNLYNIVIWNGVIVSSIWLLRYYSWSRKMLKSLLGLDMIVTVIHLLWSAWHSQLSIQSPGWLIFMNTMQVGAIVVLSHPRIVNLVETMSSRSIKSVPSCNDSDL